MQKLSFAHFFLKEKSSIKNVIALNFYTISIRDNILFGYLNLFYFNVKLKYQSFIVFFCVLLRLMKQLRLLLNTQNQNNFLCVTIFFHAYFDAFSCCCLCRFQLLYSIAYIIRSEASINFFLFLYVSRSIPIYYLFI